MAFVITDECLSCGACAAQCPAEAISMGDLHLRSMPTSALSAVLAQHSALQRLSRLSKPEKTEKTRCGKTMPRFFFFSVASVRL